MRYGADWTPRTDPSNGAIDASDFPDRGVRGVLAAALTGAALLATGPAVTIPTAADGQRPGGVRVQTDNDHWPSGHVLAGDTPRDDHYPGAGG